MTIQAGGRLWMRAARVRLNGVVVAEHLPGVPSHRIEFSAVRHNRVEPNDAQVTIYGLSEKKRARITSSFESAREVVLRSGDTGSVGDLVLEAGYGSVLQEIFRGDITRIEHEFVTPGWMTVIKARDGVLPFGNALVNESFAPGVDLNTIMRAIGGAMKIASLDADSKAVLQEAFTASRITNAKGGYVVQGPAQQALTEFLERLKLSWTFQGGKMVITRFDHTDTQEAVVLSPSTGLTKRLQVGDFGRATAESRLNGLLMPGRQVKVQDDDGTPQGAGTYRVDQDVFSGNTDSGPWNSTLELREAIVLRSPPVLV